MLTTVEVEIFVGEYFCYFLEINFRLESVFVYLGARSIGTVCIPAYLHPADSFIRILMPVRLLG